MNNEETPDTFRLSRSYKSLHWTPLTNHRITRTTLTSCWYHKFTKQRVLVSTSALLLWEIWAIFGQYYMNVSLFQTKEWKSTRFQLFCVNSRVRLTWKVAKTLVQSRFYLSLNFVVLIVPESNNISVKQGCTYLACLRDSQPHKHQYLFETAAWHRS